MTLQLLVNRLAELLRQRSCLHTDETLVCQLAPGERQNFSRLSVGLPFECARRRAVRCRVRDAFEQIRSSEDAGTSAGLGRGLLRQLDFPFLKTASAYGMQIMLWIFLLAIWYSCLLLPITCLLSPA